MDLGLVETYYPGSVQILDFFHAKGHLCQFAVECFHDKGERNEWVEEKCGQLLDDKIETLIEDLKKLPVKNEKLNKLKTTLIKTFDLESQSPSP